MKPANTFLRYEITSEQIAVDYHNNETVYFLDAIERTAEGTEVRLNVTSGTEEHCQSEMSIRQKRRANAQNPPHFYVAQERASAPGVAGEWPGVIPHPSNKNGRLKKVDGMYDLLCDAYYSLYMLAHREGRLPAESVQQTLDRLSELL